MKFCPLTARGSPPPPHSHDFADDGSLDACGEAEPSALRPGQAAAERAHPDCDVMPSGWAPVLVSVSVILCARFEAKSVECSSVTNFSPVCRSRTYAVCADE